MQTPSTPFDTAGFNFEFTRQEEKILKLAAEGHSNKEIGLLLFIAESTVKCHRQNIMQKAGISGKNEMMKYLMRLNAQSTTKGL
jgi:DNA-binding NarL/FixJ family response regulator